MKYRTLITGWLMLGMALVFAGARWGMAMDWLSWAASLGCGWLILVVSSVLPRPRQLRTLVWREAWLGLVMVGLVVALSVVGYLEPNSILNQWLIIGLGWSGWGWWLWQHRQARERTWWWPLVVVVGTLWLSGQVWGREISTPLWGEKVVTGAAHPDLLFHLSLTNMIRYYHTVSTGVDGLVFIPYHVGSHVLFAGLASVLRLSTATFYTLTYPVVFLPLLVGAVLGAGQAAARLAIPTLRNKVNFDLANRWLSWLVVAGWLIGAVPPAVQNQLGLVFFPALSESYALAQWWFLALVPLALNWWWWTNRRWPQQSDQAMVWRLQWWVAVMLAVGLWYLGLIKISHLLVLWPVGLWLGWRQQWWRRPEIVVVGSGLAVGTVALWFTVQLPEHQPHVSIGHYWLRVITLPWLPWWLLIEGGLFGLWRGWAKTRQQRLVWELGVVAGLVGLVPGLVWQTPGNTVQYFLDVHRWLALVVVLAWVPAVQPGLKRWWRRWRRRTVMWWLVAMLLLPWLGNALWPMALLVKDVQFRRAELVSQLGSVDLRLATQNLTKVQTYQQLVVLDDMRQTQRQGIFLTIGREQSYWQLQPHCEAAPLVAPAIAGIALRDGLPTAGCDLSGYGYRQYLVQ